MNIHQKKKILFISLIILFLASLVLGSSSKEIAIFTILPLFVIWIFLHNIWWRCPHCKKNLGRLEHGITHCKYCGKKL